MNESAFIHLAELARRRAGIMLTPDKSRTIARRLVPVAQIFGFKDSATLLNELAHPHEELAQAVAEAITTQDTSFFRDAAVFEHFEREILPNLIAARAGRKRLRIWSAGCATGQETYSLGMILAEANLGADGWAVDLIGTDLSTEAIARAKESVYSQYEIQRGLPVTSRSRHFIQDADGWRPTERLRRSVVFRTFNLLDHFGWLGELDVIFCRNVLIYFTPEEKAAVLEKLAQSLAADGRLVLGAAEGSTGNTQRFRPASGPRGTFLKS